MAPTPSSSTSVKGKARTYLCRPCGSRHAAPTGLNCRLQRQKTARATLVDNRRSPSKAKATAIGSVKKVGRPRKVPIPASTEMEDSSSDDGPIADILMPLQRAPSVRPIPAPRRRVSIQPARLEVTPGRATSSPRPPVTEVSHEQLGNSFDSDRSRSLDTQLILNHINQIREDNADEIRCIEHEAVLERARVQEERRVEKEFLTDTILSIQQSIAGMRDQAPPITPVTPRSEPAKPPTPTPSPRRPLPSPRSSVATATTTPAPRSPPSVAVPGMSLQGQPPSIDITPVEVAAANDHLQMLRHNKPTSDVASIILQEVGLARAIELDKAYKGKSSKSSNKVKAGDAKWPNDYVFRLVTDEDPTYDSLNVMEFVSGYICIIAEVTPDTPQNAKLIQHLFYLRQLMDDCASLDWSQVRAAHRLVLMAIVHNRLDWNNKAAVKEEKAIALSRVHMVKDVAPPKNPANSQAVPCAAYQKDTCLYSADHTTDGITVLHCCAHCHKKTGKQHIHPRKECNRFNRNGRAKNGKQTGRESKE